MVKVFKKDLMERTFAHHQTNTNGTSTLNSNHNRNSKTPVSTIPCLNRKNLFPDPELGKKLLSAITKHMAKDTSNHDIQVSHITSPLPDEFKEDLVSFFRRSSELLRHFFGLRSLLDQSHSDAQQVKLSKIVKGMEAVYRDMEDRRKNFPLDEQGETMKKMYMPIMDQLDNAFQLRKGSGGGFSTVSF